MTAASRRTPSMPSRAPICAIGWPEQLRYPQNNHVSMLARLLQKNVLGVEGLSVFWGFSTASLGTKHMEAQNPQYFRSAFFKFLIRIPLNWRFTNPAWSPMAQLKNASDSNEHWINQAGLPFCCAMQHHGSESHAYPTLQVSARPCKMPDNTTAAEILNQQIQFIKEKHEDFELIQSTSEAIVSGHRTNLIRATFSFSTMPNNEIVKFNILARTYTIFTPEIAFTIGLSSSNDNKHFNEADFNAIISSVRIGT